MVCIGVMVSDGASCVAGCCSRTAHYKSGHNPNTQTFSCFICQALQQFRMSGRGQEEAEKWRNGAGESLERHEATGTDRVYG